jgi:hypothetical protein
VAHVLDGWPLHVESMEAVTDASLNLGVATGVARRYMGGTWPPLPLRTASVWGTRGECAKGYPLPLGDPGAWPPGKFFANRRRKYVFSRPRSVCQFHHRRLSTLDP